MSKTRFELSRESGIHKRLSALIGTWNGTTHTWIEPDRLFDKSAIQGTIRTISNERFLLYEYFSSIHGEPCQGSMLLGYDLAQKLFHIVWTDTFHTDTGIVNFVGTDGAILTADEAPAHQSKTFCWQWRTEINQLDYNTISISLFTISPEKLEHKIIESRLVRSSN